MGGATCPPSSMSGCVCHSSQCDLSAVARRAEADAISINFQCFVQACEPLHKLHAKIVLTVGQGNLSGIHLATPASQGETSCKVSVAPPPAWLRQACSSSDCSSPRAP